MKNSLQVSSFSSENTHKTYSNVPHLEGFSNDNNSELYSDVYNFLNNNVNYEECKKTTQQNCSEYKFHQVDKVQNELEQIKKETEKANQELIFCKNQETSCKQIYNEIINKTKEFDELHNKLMQQEEQINRCQHKKDECDSYQKKIKDLEKLLETYESEIQKLDTEAKKLFC